MPTLEEIEQNLHVFRMERAPIRKIFNRTVREVEAELLKPEMDKFMLGGFLRILDRKAGVLADVDSRILDNLRNKALFPEVAEAIQQEIVGEQEGAESYQDRLCLLRPAVETALDMGGSSYASCNGSAANHHPEGRPDRKFKLPKIEWKKFSGNPKEWLGFWGQFQKIHEDADMGNADKFQYLLQAVEKGSRAGELVASFPPSADCYPKAIDSLKSRFGRDETLVEVYVRELLLMVMKNAATQTRTSLASLYDKLETSLRALEVLGVTSNTYAAMLYPMVESCLPEDVLRTWERSRSSRIPAVPAGAVAALEEVPAQPNQLTLLMTFLRSEVEGEERISMARTGFQLGKEDRAPKKSREKSQDVPTAAGLFSGSSSREKKVTCIFCGKNHNSQDCFRAPTMTLEQKKKIATEKKTCASCLRNHPGKCKAALRCPLCSKGHCIVMCPHLEEKKGCSDSSSTSQNDPSTTLSNQTCTKEVTLQTLLVRIYNGEEERVVRALIDGGSQRSYIDDYAAKTLGYSSIGEEKIRNCLFGGVTTKEKTHQKFRVWLRSMDGKYQCNFVTLNQQRICGSIPRVQPGSWMKQLKEKGIRLTDVGSGLPEIRLLIGGDVAAKLYTGQIHDFPNGPVAIETRLGWTLSGKMTNNDESTAASLVTTMTVANADLQNLWKLDTLGITDPAEKQTQLELQQAAMDYFQKTVTRDPDGRYEVSLPWISNHGHLKSNRLIAEKRLLSATKKLQMDGLISAYHRIFQEWMEEGVIERVPEEERKRFGHYLPHRAILKANSQTTPVRPVFDASSHEKFSPSLNDCLEKGVNLLELIPDVLARFRLERFGVISDIKKAFLQMSMRPADRDFLRFLWWEDPVKRDQMVEFRHRRVLFGVSSSPFLLGATIQHHLDAAPPNLEETSQKLKSSFYVDNSVTSFRSKEEVRKFVEEATEMMSSAKFDLRGWTCNSEFPDKDESIPVLGLIWNLKEDTLGCDMTDFTSENLSSVTKRKILSAAHRIFDPIGFTCPVTLAPKLLLQEAWLLKVGWDDELTGEIVEKFQKWYRILSTLAEVKVPRWLFGVSCDRATWTLHVFVDASKVSYATCLFVRGEGESGAVVQLVSAKTRVAPVKTVSIPRLELMACCIGARLAASYKNSIAFSNMKTYYWTDSANALAWIQKNEQWATFVANRVKEIRELTDFLSWRHVPGHLNPADLPSRGCTAKQLLESAWWEGPEWLRLEELLWPNNSSPADDDIVNAEKRKTVTTQLVTTVEKISTELMMQMSEYNSILRVVAYMRRLGAKRQDLPNRPRGILTVQELEAAEMTLIKLIQRESLEDDGQLFRNIGVYKDEAGIFRVKTKITRRTDCQLFKSPAVLPHQHPLVRALIRAKHEQMCHAGVQFVQSALREKFWVLRSRKTIKDVIHSCILCRRFDAKRVETVQTALPVDRVREGNVFEVTGVDLAGPLFLRGKKKVWVVLYTCAIYRAVHLELVESLSTEAFLLTLRRFVARRGRPTTIYSDNGTNFVGADNLFSNADWGLIQKSAAVQRIEWRFIPPTAAWYGGWWERLVQTVKRILRRVIGKASLHYAELETILCDVEAIVNGRPLTYMSEDPDDLTPLTPAMFLQGLKTGEVADLDHIDGQSLNKRLRFLQRLRDDLRTRFRTEYLGMLIQPRSSQRNVRDVVPGNIVLIGHDVQKRIDWVMAKVLEVYPGPDGITRVVKLKTAKGELIRPVQRLYPLEVSFEEFHAAVTPYRADGDQRRPTANSSPFDNSGSQLGPLEEVTASRVVPVKPAAVIPPKKAVVNPEHPVEAPVPVIVTRSGRKVRIPVRLGY